MYTALDHPVLVAAKALQGTAYHFIFVFVQSSADVVYYKRHFLSPFTRKTRAESCRVFRVFDIILLF
jgi:hypothetical protein